MEGIKRNQYLYFTKRFLVFTFIVFALDYGIGSALRYFYFKPKPNYEVPLIYSFDKTKEDILIFGSSRANHHYRPDVFEQYLNHTCYNNGVGLGTMDYHLAILRSTLRRYTPKLIILDIRTRELKPIAESSLYNLLPFYKTHPEVRPLIDSIGYFEKYKLLASEIYPFNSMAYRIAVDNLLSRNNVESRGYAPLHKVWKSTMKVQDDCAAYTINQSMLYSYEMFIKECMNAEIKLIIVQSPYFLKLKCEDLSIKLFKDIASRYNMKYLDFSQDTSLTNYTALFSDERHLNHRGAEIFSKMVADTLSGMNKTEQWFGN